VVIGPYQRAVSRPPFNQAGVYKLSSAWIN